MRVLIMSDKPNWAYHSIAKSVMKYNTDKSVKMDLVHIKGNVSRIKKMYKAYDLFFVMGWQNYPLVKFIPKNQVITGVHSHHSWDNKKTTPKKNVNPPRSLIQNLSEFKAVNAVSKRLYDLFKKNGLKKIHYTPNAVDTNVFFNTQRRKTDNFYVGYSGSKAHDWRKGITDYIVPSVKKAGAKLKIAMLSSGNYVPLEKMPRFYNQLHCYVCASSSEGYSLSVLEAAATGNVIITTAVGGTDELINDGENGFIVDRNVNRIAQKIRFLKDNPDIYQQMSENMSSWVKKNWCWSQRHADWIKFIKRNV